MASVHVRHSHVLNGLPSPTLTNPDMVLPDELPIQSNTSPLQEMRRPPSPTYLLNHVRGQDDVDRASVRSKKSLGSMSRRLALQRSTTAEDNAPLSRSFSRPTPNSRGKAQSPPTVGRKTSFASASTLDWDTIPEFDEDGSESDEGDAKGSGAATPTKPPVEGHSDRSSSEPHDDSDGARRSSAELSRRAELILANAKARLNLMDRNLKGARALTAENLQRAASLHNHKSPYSSRYFGSRDEPDTPDRSPMQSRTHSRNTSDVQLPPRASTALGGEIITEEDEGEGKSWPTTPLRPVRSQEVLQTGGLRSRRSISRPQMGVTKTPRASLSPDHASSETDSSDSSSPATMQLRQQVQNLNRRISVLKEKTKEDNLRRQSMQNLREPNPLTDAEQDAERRGVRVRQSASVADIRQRQSYSNNSHWSAASSLRRPSVDMLATASPPNAHSSPKDTPQALPEAQTNGTYDRPESPHEGLDDTEIGNGESPQVSRFSADSDMSPRVNDPEASQRNSATFLISDEDTPHEERQDAFDYHSFFLHSALGSASHMSDSSSEASDDTARAIPLSPEADEPYETPEKLHQIERGLPRRMGTADSSSSGGTFATATEELRAQSVSPTKAAQGQGSSDGADSAVALQDRDRGVAHRRPATDQIAAQVSRISAPPATIAVAAMVDPDRRPLGLRDRALVFMLMESTKKICERLQLENLPPGEERVLRRRLEEARRVIDGIAPVVSSSHD